ncbi:MAG: hypothetical protein JO040_10110 [Gemmatimonadetes bacterium]|nr:hypothetical protein [Gemmatimonadota bacterium]
MGERPGFVGLDTVPADRYGEGYPRFHLRADLAGAYLRAYRQVRALGGVLTSSGAIRALSAEVTPGRSSTSLHYTGRAIDLYLRTGMQGPDDPYLVARDGGPDEAPLWKVYCVSSTPETDHPLYDESLLLQGEMEYALWTAGEGYRTARRRVVCFSLTDVLAAHGWQRIPSRPEWRTSYPSVEWWHFQHHAGLVPGETRFGDELERVWPAERVAASGLELGAVWRGLSFGPPE